MIDRYKSFYNPYKGNLLFIFLLNIYNEYRLIFSKYTIIETWCAEHFDEPPSVAMDVNSMSTCR
ncbi:MAG: Transcriptional regulator, LysR family, partial [Veillonella dispar DORA_11]